MTADALQNLPPTSSPPFVSRLSPNNKPALSRQRDHSACRRQETPLKVRKTRENLRQQTAYPDIPPPCVDPGCEDRRGAATGLTSCTSFVVKSQAIGPAQDATDRITASSASPRKDENEHAVSGGASLPGIQVQRQKSISRRMLSKVKQGMSTRSRSSQSVRPTESETSLVRRISGRRKQSRDLEEQRARSFDIARNSIDSQIDETIESSNVVPSVEQRSVTASTVSTAELLGIRSTSNTPDFSHQVISSDCHGLAPIPSSSSPLDPTPRPPPRKDLPVVPLTVPHTLHVPCVDLNVTLSSASVDLHSKHDVWVAIVATITTSPTVPDPQTAPGQIPKTDQSLDVAFSPIERSTIAPSNSKQCICGNITTLRLCYKPVGGCSVRDVVGQKSIRDLAVGQRCSLFVKVHVPRLRIKESASEVDQHSLFAELESMVGTLKMEILHVEVRYRHSLLPFNNVVTVRHTCKVKRPKLESRWSFAGLDDTTVEPSSDAHALLAKYLASEYSAEEALTMLQRYLDPTAHDHPIIRGFRESLTAEINRSNDANSAPSVVITDSEVDITTVRSGGKERHEGGLERSVETLSMTIPSKTCEEARGQPIVDAEDRHSTAPLTSTRDSLSSSPIHPVTPTFQSTRCPASSEIEHDSARQLWRHIRRNSLSAEQQLDSVTNDSIQYLDIYDEATKALHRQAVANKRSVGAETLRAWKWDQNMLQRDMPESPWM